MASVSVRILVWLVAAYVSGAAANAQRSPAAAQRAQTIRALETLIVTGAPGHVVNPRAAPPRYIASLGDMSGCPGR